MGSDGHVRITGLGAAFIPSTLPAVSVDRSFQDAASELIDARQSGFADTGITMAGDVYEFAVLAWEVRVMFVVSPDKPLRDWVCG